MNDKKIVCIDKFNNRITLSYDYPFFIKNLTGFHTVEGTVSTSKNAFSVGEKYNGTSIPKRNLFIAGEIDRDFFNKRQQLYKIFALKSEGTLYYYENNIVRKIAYQVEKINIEDSGIPRNFDISLICLNPYFTDTDETVVSIANWIPTLEFPIEVVEGVGMEFGYKSVSTLVTIENDTNIVIGMRIVFKFSDIVKNPALINVNTQEKMVIEKEFVAGDEVTVTTYTNNKNIVLKHNGVDTNINNYLKFGSKFLEIYTGSNTFKPTSESGEDNFTTEIYYLTNYEAV